MKHLKTVLIFLGITVILSLLIAACDIADNNENDPTSDNVVSGDEEGTKETDTLIFEERMYIKTEVKYPSELMSAVSKNAWFAEVVSAADEKDLFFVNNGNVYRIEKSPLYKRGLMIFDVVNENTKEAENLYSFLANIPEGFVNEVFVEEGTALLYPEFDVFYSVLAKTDMVIVWRALRNWGIYVEKINGRPQIHDAIPLINSEADDALKANEDIALNGMPGCSVDINIVNENILSVFMRSSGHEFLYGWASYLYDTENKNVINKAEYLASHGVNLEEIQGKVTKKKAAYENDSSVIRVKTSIDEGVYDIFLQDAGTAVLHYAIIVEYADVEGEQNPAYYEQTMRVSIE